MPKLQHIDSDIGNEIHAGALQALPGAGDEFALEAQQVLLTFQMNQLCTIAVDYLRTVGKGELTDSRAAYIVQEATRVDDAHEQWASQFPVSLCPREESDELSGTRVLTYGSMILPALHNMYRASRIVLHELRLRCAAGLSSRVRMLQDGTQVEQNYDESVWQSATIIRAVAEDIRASLPYCLGDTDSEGSPKSEPLCPGVLAGAYLLLWPLVVMRLATCTTKEQRQAATSALERIGNDFGIKQAHKLLRDHKSLFES